MSRFWSETVRELSPYVPGEQPRRPGLIKLNTNESPYPPSPRVMAAIAAVAGDDLRRYPDPGSAALCSVLAGRAGLRPEQVFVGNGSDEVLAHVFQALLCHPPQRVLFPDISYSFYPVWCRLYGVPWQTVELRQDYSVRVEDYRGAGGGIIIPNPNAPTGIALPLVEIRRLLEGRRDSVVVIDEAYVDFGAESAVSLIPEFDNLLVVQTLSKSRALAGMRVGMAFGHEDLVEGLRRVKDSFNSYPLDVVAQRAAVASLEDEVYFRECRDRIIASRERLAAGLRDAGFEVLPSAANFLFVRHPEHRGKDLFSGLRERGILVRHFDRPRIAEFLRISVGTEADCDAVLRAVGELVS